MIEIKLDKIFFLKILAVTAFILLVITSVLSIRRKMQTDSRNLRISIDSVETRFVNTLTGLGIKNTWIEKKSVKNSKLPGVDSLFEITVPADLPIAVILAELNKQYIQDSAKLNAVEKEIRGATELKISIDNNLKLLARFTYDKKSIRSTAKAAILITGVENEKNKDQQSIIQLPEQISFLVVPSKKSSELLKSFLQYRKEYAVLLNDDISDTEFKLDKKYSKGRLTNSIKDIVGVYKEAKYFVIDDNSSLTNPETYNIITDEFLKRNIKLIHLSKFNMIEGSNDEDLKNKFETKLNSICAQKTELFLLDISDFNSIIDTFQELRKKGLKYVSVSDAEIDN
jgi:hypothetical protein